MLPRQASVVRRAVKRVPTCWLMTDRRLGNAMPGIVARMPPRSAIVIRPYAMAGDGRAVLVRRLRHVARAKRHLLLLAGSGSLTGFDGRHLGGGSRKTGQRPGFVSMSVHNRREAAAALKRGADAALISPVHATRSHPGSETLGLRGFASIAARFGGRAIALGGMTVPKFRWLRCHGASGWAAIDAWLDDGP